MTNLLQSIALVSEVPEDDLINVYLFGSRVYGTQSNTSDYDIVAIVPDSIREREILQDGLNIHLTHEKTFQRLLSEHNIGAIEQILSPIKLKELKTIPFTLDTHQLRVSISSTVSNSWSECFKKILQGDYDIGIKSMFHSLRIGMYGIQLAEHGKVTDWACANHIKK